MPGNAQLVENSRTDHRGMERGLDTCAGARKLELRLPSDERARPSDELPRVSRHDRKPTGSITTCTCATPTMAWLATTPSRCDEFSSGCRHIGIATALHLLTASRCMYTTCTSQGLGRARGDLRRFWYFDRTRIQVAVEFTFFARHRASSRPPETDSAARASSGQPSCSFPSRRGRRRALESSDIPYALEAFVEFPRKIGIESVL